MSSKHWKHKGGSAVEYFAVGAALCVALCLFIGYSAQQLASEGELPTIAFLSPDQYVAKKSRPPNFNAVDYTATGSLKGQTIVLDPCTGRQKAE